MQNIKKCIEEQFFIDNDGVIIKYSEDISKLLETNTSIHQLIAEKLYPTVHCPKEYIIFVLNWIIVGDKKPYDTAIYKTPTVSQMITLKNLEIKNIKTLYNSSILEI